MIASSAKSRVSANRNIAVTIVVNEQRNHLPYVIPHIDIDAEAAEDSDGNVLLHQLFVNRLDRLDQARAAPPRSGKAIFGKPSKPGNLNKWQTVA